MSVIASVRDKVRQAKKALQTAHGSVADVRNAIQRLKAERESIRSAPVPVSEALGTVEATADHLAGSAHHILAGLVADAARGQPSRIDLHILHKNELVGLVATILATDVRRGLAGAVEEHYQTVEPGLAADDRARRLAEIDAELQRLEVEEEGLIVGLAEAGVHIERRPDASPAAILGVIGK
jgi:hypothetical protein